MRKVKAYYQAKELNKLNIKLGREPYANFGKQLVSKVSESHGTNVVFLDEKKMILGLIEDNKQFN